MGTPTRIYISPVAISNCTAGCVKWGLRADVSFNDVAAVLVRAGAISPALDPEARALVGAVLVVLQASRKEKSA